MVVLVRFSHKPFVGALLSSCLPDACARAMGLFDIYLPKPEGLSVAHPVFLAASNAQPQTHVRNSDTAQAAVSERLF